MKAFARKPILRPRATLSRNINPILNRPRAGLSMAQGTRLLNKNKTMVHHLPYPNARRRASTGAPRATNTLVFYVNKQRVELQPRELTDPSKPLIHFLRRNHAMNPPVYSPKLTCGEGGCGACTVSLAKYNPTTKNVEYKAVNSCLFPVASAHNCQIITTEGLGNMSQPHPIQERFASFGASQCGFCTPGFIMSMWSGLKNDLVETGQIKKTEHDIVKCMDGNLCRCTGYRPIIDVAKSFASDTAADFKHPYGEKMTAYDPSVHDPEFPQELKKPVDTLMYSGLLGLWAAPVTKAELLAIKTQGPNAHVSSGYTETGIETRYKGARHPIQISPMNVEEISSAKIKTDKEGNTTLEIGANMTLSNLEKFLKSQISGGKFPNTQVFESLLYQLKWFAGTPIRNTATPAGNVVNASPISDLNPIFLATNAIFVLESASNVRRVKAQDFFVGYKKTAIKKEEILTFIEVPLLKSEMSFCDTYKQCRRREDDISIVTGCFTIDLAPDHTIQSARIGLGGMGATPRMCPKTQEFLVGKKFSLELYEQASKALLTEVALADNTPGGMERYREALCTGFLLKFWLKILLQTNAAAVPTTWKSAVQKLYEAHKTTSQQEYPKIPSETAVQKTSEPIHALKQSTGESTYPSDYPSQHRELQCFLVQSTIGRGTLKSIDASQLPSGAFFFSAKDIAGSNLWGDIVKDEEFFVEKDIVYHGQPLGLVVGESKELAAMAAKSIKVHYDQVEQPIVSIEQAIQAQSFFPTVNAITVGNPDVALQNAATVVEGVVNSGGQEHFYFEPMSTLAIPSDGDQIALHVSTQNAHKTQYFTASALGIKANQVVSKTSRIGGGFGGKETRNVPFSVYAALAAHKLRRPVRIKLPRNIDMAISGTRHPFRGEYKIGVDASGKILGGHVNLYANGGHSHDLSYPVLSRAVLFSDGAYNIPNLSVVGRVCKTNLPSNTAFRGFGGPQGALVVESWIDHIAHTLHKRPEDIREANLQEQGTTTFYNQPIPRSLRRSWDTCKQKSDFEARYNSVQEFNAQHRFRKRGIALVPTKYGCAFNFNALNQGGALVHVYQDGSVLVSHGGVEMGQGLNTKVSQVVAHELGVPLSAVTVQEMATDKVANAPPTAGSMGTDIFAGAAQDAARQIAQRLQPLREERPGASLGELAVQAWLQRIDLSAHGFFKSPHEGYVLDSNQGKPWRYFTLGTACTEVEIDTLTGDHKVLRTDLVVDIGQSLNPLVDLGQIEGAFVQGQGWTTLEEVFWADDDHAWGSNNQSGQGRFMATGPGTYKIPSIDDIPQDWRVTVLSHEPKETPDSDTLGVHSSKAVGEPPLLLGLSVPMALRMAIKAARADNGVSEEWIDVLTPITSERIRLMCGDLGNLPLKKSV